MALLSTLVKAVADVEGIDEVQVGWIARHLREAGMITQAGRGRGAAHMNSADAANLIIGVNSATGAKNGAEAVKVYRDLLCGKADLLRYSELSNAFKIGQTFGPSLEVLIDLSMHMEENGSALERCVFRSSHFSACLEADEVENSFRMHRHRLGEIISSEIVFGRPYASVSVLIADNTGNDANGNSILDKDRPIAEVEFWDRSATWPIDADRDERIRVSLKTLLRVGNVLSK